MAKIFEDGFEGCKQDPLGNKTPRNSIVQTTSQAFGIPTPELLAVSSAGSQSKS
jgi:hypothetical protein